MATERYQLKWFAWSFVDKLQDTKLKHFGHVQTLQWSRRAGTFGHALSDSRCETFNTPLAIWVPLNLSGKSTCNTQDALLIGCCCWALSSQHAWLWLTLKTCLISNLVDRAFPSNPSCFFIGFLYLHGLSRRLRHPSIVIKSPSCIAYLLCVSHRVSQP